MKFLMVFLMGLMLSVQANTTPQFTVSGQVRLADGRPVAGAQVTLFDLADLHQGAVARARTDASGYFALPLASLGGSALPQGFVLGPNYPNPFNPSTVIPYQLPTATHVRLDVFNVLGQHVATLVDAERQAGFHAAKWDATNAAGQAMAAGVYFYRLTVGGGQQIQRMVLIDGQAGIATAASSTAAPMPTSTDAADREYGLVVSGEGLTTYADAAFGVRGGMAAVELVVDAAPLTTGKVWAGEILGDVNNDGQVLLEDAMLVVMYRSNPSIVMPNNGSIRLGDVNSDGEVNETDVLVMMRYISNPLDGALPAGIGQRMASGKRASDGSGVSRLTHHENSHNQTPIWSPYGSHIAFSSYRNGIFDIYVMKVNGDSLTNLTNNSDSRDETPTWSPDGDHLAFSSYRDGNFDIYVMKVNGDSLTNLTDHGNEDKQPAWSPDGRYIAFSSNRDGDPDVFDIYRMAADGSDVRRLTNHRRRNWTPTWSPDGRYIAFSSDRDDGDFDIYRMAADGSDVRRLTNHDEEDKQPAWSPDGRYIAFSSNRDGDLAIYVMAAEDGSGVRPLTVTDRYADLQPAWSPDGRHLAFSSNRDDEKAIYVMALGEGEQEGPSFGTQVVVDQTYTAGDEVILALPAASGGTGALTYSLDGDLPAGLAFDDGNRTLSGTLPADALYAAYGLTYRVADAAGAGAELSFTIVVMKVEEVDDSDTPAPGEGEQEGPSFGAPVVGDQTYTAGDEVILALPAASGGTGALTYSLDGDLPAGLAFDDGNRTLSGTLPADALYAAYGLTYRVADAAGAGAELSFTIVVMKVEEQEPTQEEEETFSLLGGASMEFVWIEPGVFQMGSDTGRRDERPIHEVEISRGFWLGKYEITQGQWKSVMDEEPWSGRDRVTSDSSYPAVIISWDKVHEFIDRLNAEAGEELYRLPTEAEWEYACRAGTQTRWSFGDDESQLTDHAWYFGNNYPTEGAKAVGGRLPNPWGLYDMHGNVWEWVQDWYDEEYYDRSGRVDPRGPTSGLGRVIRGGHFGHIDGVRSAYRHFHSPDARSYTIGARLLRMDESN